MDTIRIGNIEEFETYRDYENQTIRIDKHVVITGNITIDNDWSLEVGGYLKVEGSLKVEGYLEVGWYLEVEVPLEVREYLRVRGSLKVEGCLEIGEYLFCLTHDIKCDSLRTHTLPFWRKYWSEMLPLQKYRDDILNKDNCWDDLRRIAQKDAHKICDWEGWYPILKAQLEMFFGLKDSVNYFKEEMNGF